MRLKPVLALLFLPIATSAGYFTPTGVGGGGWLQSGAFLPSNPDVIVVGADVSGVYRTDDFGLHWYPWNEGLPNTDDQMSNYVDDLVGVDYNGWLGFYAATRAGIFRAQAAGSWECLTPVPDYSYKDKDFYHANAIPFSCLDWPGDSLLVAGAGSVRWRTTYELNYYPGLDSSRFEPYGAYDEQWSVWTLDLDGPYASWEPDSSSTFGAARDISVAYIEGTTYMALATPNGIYLRDTGGWTSVGGPLYGLDLSCWSLHLTKRGTLYAGMLRPPGGPSPSGVYRIFDVRNPTGWSWVGDETKLAPDSLSLDQIGGSGSDLIYVSVIDGEESDPDLLYLVSRNSDDAIFRGYQSYTDEDGTCTWEHKIYWKTDKTYWYMDGSGVEHPLDMGWHCLTPPAVIFEPIVSRFHPDRVGLHISSRIHVSPDRGDTWLQRYTTNVGGYWRSNGYNELGVDDFCFMSDGRCVESNGDNGVFRSSDMLLETWERLGPPVNPNATAQSDTAWNYDTGSVCVRGDWLGSGEDALFVVAGDVMQWGTPCKLFIVDELDQWHHITGGLNSDEYMFMDLVFSDDSTCFMPYRKYDDRVGTGSIEELGVLKGTYEDGDWSWTPVNDGLTASTVPDSCNASGAEIIFHEPSRRIFMAALHTKFVLPGQTEQTILNGAIYMLPSPDSTTWRREFGGEGTDWRDFRCIAQSADGTVLYAGTRGRSGMGWGGVLKCENPDSVVTTWTPLANTAETGYPFGFVTPFWRATWSYVDVNRILTDVRSVAVDPWNPDVVYAGMVGTGFTEKEGVWVYNRWGNGFWEHLSEREAFAGITINCLKFSPVEQGRLLVGTHGHESYHVRIDSLQSMVSVRDSKPRLAAGLRLLGIYSKLGGRRTTVCFSLSRPSQLEMQIFDVMGRLVCRHRAGRMKAGESSLGWDGRNVNGRPCASGVYFARLTAGREKAAGKFRLLR